MPSSSRVLAVLVGSIAAISLGCVGTDGSADSGGSNDAGSAAGSGGKGGANSGTGGSESGPGTGDGGTGDSADGGGGSDGNSPPVGSYNPNPDCLSIDRLDASKIVPPAGLQLSFRLLDCQGNAVRSLVPADADVSVDVINGETGKSFNSSSEGGSASPATVLEQTELYSVLVLDLSESIVNNAANPNAQSNVIDAATAFVNEVLGESGNQFRHEVAIVAFGSPSLTAIEQDFTADASALLATLESLRVAGSRGTTDLYGAYMQGLEMVEAKGTASAVVERFLVVVTDGTHEAGNSEQLRAEALSRKNASEVRTFSVGVQGDYDSCAIEELAGGGCREGDACNPDTASAACYQFISVDEFADLVPAFEDISARALGIARSNYVVGVCTPVALGSPDLTLRITLDGLSAPDAVASYVTDSLDGIVGACDAAAIATQPLFCSSNVCEVACAAMQCGDDRGIACGDCGSGAYCSAASLCLAGGDLDGDFVPDATDVCPSDFDPGQQDADGNGLGDACNTAEDADGDDWADGLDICPANPDPNQGDRDADGVGDACNSNIDRDGDDWADVLDNCRFHSNSSQLDSDGNGEGDACQNLPLCEKNWGMTVEGCKTLRVSGERHTVCSNGNPHPKGCGYVQDITVYINGVAGDDCANTNLSPPSVSSPDTGCIRWDSGEVCCW